MKKTAIIVLSAISLFTAIVFMDGCRKDADDSQNNSNTLTGNSKYFITGLLGGQPVSIEGTPTYYSNSTNVEDSTHLNPWEHHDHDADDSSGFVTGSKWISSDMATTNGSMELRRLSVRVYVAPITGLSNQFYGMIATGPVNFAYNPDPNNGVYLAVRDKNNVVWTTKGDQTGSTFQITSRGDNRGTYATFSGLVTCKMYDGQGNMKPFTSVAFSAIAGLQ
ncbi:MAG TPA: hypothetical protein VG603_06100 [Chitinophagales bacterium]|nr:hypothetical protein [Chitinophagales bacterium]